MKTLTAEELKKKIDANEDFVLVNVLGEDSFQKKRIPKSINIPVDKLEEEAPKQLPEKEKDIVVYCASTECQASPTAAKKLESMGYTNVADFEAGLQGWQDAGQKFEGSEAA